ncbi:UNVERIFIED_CONTAM: hypothetical protein FKN15_002902 [Acipenser sinensis]
MSKSGMYAIMTDEARDGQSEQLALCVRAIPEAAEFFSFLENVYSFFSTSLVNHHKFKEAQSKLGIASAELVQLSNTRWACQLWSINAVLDTLTAIFDCLSAIGSPMAVGLRAKLHKFSTVYLLLMFQSLLSITEGLHKFLQKETVDLAEACFGKQAVCDTLIGKRTDAFATKLYDRTKALCEIHNIPEADAARKRKQRKMGKCGSDVWEKYEWKSTAQLEAVESRLTAAEAELNFQKNGLQTSNL